MYGTIRSFVAFDIDNELVVRRLSEVQGMLVNTGADLKLVKPQNIHVTMRFLGNISLSMVDLIHEEMKQIFFTSFNIELRGLGAFPSLRYARVVWAGIRKGANELMNVFDQVEPRLRRLGFKPDPKGFSPHLTIARVRTGRHKAELIRCVEDLADYEFGVINADRLRLKKSVLTPKGPIYTTLREVHGAKELTQRKNPSGGL
jgi:2'-5' RNA ligase